MCHNLTVVLLCYGYEYCKTWIGQVSSKLHYDYEVFIFAVSHFIIYYTLWLYILLVLYFISKSDEPVWQFFKTGYEIKEEDSRVRLLNSSYMVSDEGLRSFWLFHSTGTSRETKNFLS